MSESTPIEAAWAALNACIRAISACLNQEDRQAWDDPLLRLSQSLADSKASFQAAAIAGHVRAWHERYPNLKLSYDKIAATLVTQHGPDWLDLHDVIAFLDSQYGRSASSKALADLTEAARSLVPYRVSSAESLVNGPIVRLFCPMEVDFKTKRRTRFAYEAVASLAALCRLAVALADDLDPATVDVPGGFAALTEAHNDHRSVVGVWWPIRPLALRFYCNGRLDVNAGRPTLARQLATTLCPEPPRVAVSMR
jgi:hypothetical protein